MGGGHEQKTIGRVKMKYVLLIHETPGNLESRKTSGPDPYIAAWRAYHKALVAGGAYVDGSPLKDVTMGTTIRLRDGRRQVQDGPFAEPKEQLGGFILIDVPSVDAALEWAARCPAAATGSVEVRPVDTGYHSTYDES
jgi:hypothetical protein